MADGGGANAMDGRGELTLGPPAKPLGPFAATPKPGQAEGGGTSKDDGTPMHLEGPQDAADEAPFKWVARQAQVAVRCAVRCIHAEGLSDGRSMATMLAQMAPFKTVIVRGDAASTAHLAAEVLPLTLALTLTLTRTRTRTRTRTLTLTLTRRSRSGSRRGPSRLARSGRPSSSSCGPNPNPNPNPTRSRRPSSSSCSRRVPNPPCARAPSP